MAREGWATPMLRAERRKQLLAVAAEIIAGDGLAALTMANVAERAGIAKPVVYAHFANRNQVVLALLEHHFQALRAYFDARLPKVATLGDYIAAVVEASFAFDSASDVPVRKITDGFSAGDEINQIFLKEEAEMQARWRDLLGVFDLPGDAAVVASAIIHGMVRTSVTYFTDMPEGEVAAAEKERAKATLVRLLIANLQTLSGFEGDLAKRPIDFSDAGTRTPTKIL